MENIKLVIDNTLGFISKDKVFAYEKEVSACNSMLHNGTGKGKHAPAL